MGSFYMESTQINYRRDETVKTVDQKLQELSETSAIDTDIAPVFKSTNTYAPGDMVYYRNKLYVFNVEHSGAWAAGDVTATDVTTEVSSLRSGLTNQGARLTDIENGTVTSAGTATEGNTIALPPAAKVVYIRANINGYYYTPMCLVRGNHINIPLCALEWIATIALNYNNNTRLWTFESETTIAGTKRNQWTTNVEVFYS